MKDYKEVVKSWLEGNFDAETKAEIKKLQETDPVGLEDAFYRNLEFGTGGLRGIMGVGTNRMNKYTVGMATQGLANYIKAHVDGAASVCIAHDSRNNSRLFAEISADVLSNNGIHVYPPHPGTELFHPPQGRDRRHHGHGQPQSQGV